MTGPGQQPEYGKGEKIVNALADGVIKALSGVAWVVRRIWPPGWMKRK